MYMYMYVISYFNCPKNSRETCLKSIFELSVHSCGSTGLMKLSKDLDSDDFAQPKYFFTVLLLQLQL